MIKVPGTLRETLNNRSLAALDEAFAPPVGSRVSGTYEIEIEMEGEGTFTLSVDDGELSASKGFAEDDPFLSCEVSAGAWPLIQLWLQCALDGFPAAPYLQRNQEALRSLGKDEQKALVQGLQKLDDVSLEINIPECGTLRVARGALDEVTRQLSLRIPRSVIEDLLRGVGSEVFQQVRVSGNRAISAELMSALGPLMRALR